MNAAVTSRVARGQLGRILPHRDRVQIDDAINAVVAVLQLDEALDGAEIVAEVQVAGGLHPRKDLLLKRHAWSPRKRAPLADALAASIANAACGVQCHGRRLALQGPAVIVRVPASARVFPESVIMPSARFDVLGIGNAIVDVIARTEEDFLLKQGMHKGTMALIDEARAQAIYDAMGPAIEMSGGSAANTIVGLASLGFALSLHRQGQRRRARPRFRHDIRAAGVAYRDAAGRRRPVDRALLRAGDAGRRAHHEYLSRRRAGSAPGRHRRRHGRRQCGSSISKAICGIRRTPRMRSSRPRKIAHEAERTVALTLSDAFCVDRWRAEFLHLMRSRTVDLIFANEAELHSLYQTADFDTAVDGVARRRRRSGGDAQREGLPGDRSGGDRGGAGLSGRARRRHDRRRRSFRGRASSPVLRAAPTTAPAAGSARWPPPR